MWIASRDRRAAAWQARSPLELDAATLLVEALAPTIAQVPRFRDKEDDAHNAHVMSLAGALGDARVLQLWRKIFSGRPTRPDSTWKVSEDDIVERPNQSRDTAFD